jgi:hypothetical protein
MKCGARWKTCECPWFSYETAEQDRPERVPVQANMRPERFDAAPPSPRAFRPTDSGLGPAVAVRPRPQNYEEEALVRKLQEQRSEDLARRFKAAGDYHGNDGKTLGIGSRPGHLMNDDYGRGPQNFAVPPSHPPPPAAVGRSPAGANCVSGGNRARGFRATPRESSLERRLADRFNPDTRQNPMRPSPVRAAPASASASPSLQAAATMPLAPQPPPAVPSLRRRTMEEEMYNSSRGTRLSDRVFTARTRRGCDAEHVAHSPAGPASRRHHNRQREEEEQEPKQSIMAGLTGPGRGMDRVYEWRTHVQPGVPEEEPLPASH